MFPQITQAINGRKRIIIDYYPGSRLIEPHAFGRGSDGQFLLRAYQVSGASASGEHVEWKLLRLDRVRGIELTEQTFDGPRPGYNARDSAMKGGVIASL